MYTQCPDCLSIFKTHLSLLKSGHGQLRCGHCGCVFDALPTLVENLPEGFNLGSRQLLARTEAAAAPPVLAMPLIEHIDADFEFKLDADDLHARSAAAIEPRVTEPEKARIEPTLDDEWAEFQRHAARIEAPDLRASDSISSRALRFSAKPTGAVPEPRASYPLDGAPGKTPILAQSNPYSPAIGRGLRIEPEIKPAAKPEPERPERQRPARELSERAMSAERSASVSPAQRTNQKSASATPWVLASLLLVLALAAQIAYYERSVILQYEAARPWLERGCKLLGCKLALRFDPQQLTVLDRDVKPHPAAKGALMISASIKNTADFAQAYPLVEIKLTDLGGKLVALRRFSPSEYLQDASALAAGLPSGASLPIVFEVQDPGRNAMNFEFAFLSENNSAR